MVKLSKFYILFACTALCLFGCGKEEANIETEAEPAETVEEAVEEVSEEREYHGIARGTIDYLSLEGISLEPGVQIAMVATNEDNSFYDVIKEGAQAAVDDLNEAFGYSGKKKVSLTFTAPEGEDVVEQINIIDQFLDKAPDALCIAFTDATACKTQMQMAKNNGIKLIAFDTPDESMMSEVLVSTDNQAAASEAAEKLFEAIGYEGKVAIIVHNSLTQTGQERKQAIVDELANHYNDKDIHFVDIVYLAQEDRSEEEILDELLERNPDLAGIICTDQLTTEMVIDYVGNLETKDFAVAGFDASEKIVKAVEDGTLIGAMSQDPYRMGYATVVAAARSIAGLTNAEFVHSDHQWIDSSNVQSEEVQSLLFY